MYAEHFGLNALSFENVPDPRFFFGHGQYEQALTALLDSVNAGRGLMVVIGPIGTGKTTLSQRLLAGITDSTRLVWMAMPSPTADQLYQFLAQEVGAQNTEDTGRSQPFLLRDLRKRLLELHAEGHRVLLVIDEAHLMTDEVLEGIRILTNLEDGPTKLVQILLLGQAELGQHLLRPELAPLKQRIATIKTLTRLSPAMTKEYIAHRLTVAGGTPAIFSPAALDVIAYCAEGSPRLINNLCNNSMRTAFERGASQVEENDVQVAAEEMDLGRKTHAFIRSRREQAASLAAARRDAPSEPPKGPARDAAPAPAPAAEARPLAVETVHRAEEAHRPVAVIPPTRPERPRRSPLARSVFLFAVSLGLLGASILYYRQIFAG